MWAQGFKGEGKSIAILDPYERPDPNTYATFAACTGATAKLEVEVVGPGNAPAEQGEESRNGALCRTWGGRTWSAFRVPKAGS